jgi:hypothetical protein
LRASFRAGTITDTRDQAAASAAGRVGSRSSVTGPDAAGRGSGLDDTRTAEAVGSGFPFSDGRGSATVRASLILKSARASDPRNLIFTKGLSVVRSHEGSGDLATPSWAGGRRVSRACCTEIARRRPSGGNELPGQVLGACQRHGRSFLIGRRTRSLPG